ncbi:MAG: tetratricopeptide repeat protein [Phycisphaerae bacterium]
MSELSSANPSPSSQVADKTRDRLWLGGIVLLALVLRLVYLLQLRHHPTFAREIMDAFYHDQWARAFAAGERFNDGPYFRAPLYPWFLGTVYKIIGPDGLGPRIVQAVVGSLSCGLVFLVGRLTFGRAVAILAGLGAATYWMLIYFDGELLIVSLLVFLDLLMLWLMLRTADRPRPLSWLIIGIVLGASAIARPNILLFAPAVLIWIVVLHRSQWRRVVGYGACFVAGICIPILPVTVRNLVVGDDLVLISSQAGVNFFIGNNPDSDGMQAVVPGTSPEWWPGYHQSIARAEKAMGRDLKPSEVSQYYSGQAFQFMGDHPGDAAALMLKKLQMFWTRWEVSNNKIIQFSAQHYTPLLTYLPLRFGLVGPLGLLGLVLSLGHAKRLFPLWGFVLIYMTSVVLFFVTARYRMPVVPVLLLLGAYAACRCIAVLRTRQWRQLGLTLMILALAAMLVTPVPVNPTFQLAQGYRSAGVAFHSQGKLAEAEPLLHKAVELAPNWPAAWSDLAHLLVARGRADQAVAQLRRALAVLPDSFEIHAHLGNLLGLQGRPSEALAHLRRSVDLNPRFSVGHSQLGTLLARTGRFDQAVVHLTRAVELLPEDVNTRQQLAQVLLQLGRTAEAKFHLERVAALEPNRADTLAALGWLSSLQGDDAQALAFFRRSLAVNAANPALYDQWARILIKHNDYARAASVLRSGLSALPANDYLCHKLASLLLSAPPPVGNPQQALTLAQGLCARDGGRDPATLSTLAAAHAALGHCPQALDVARQALPMAEKLGGAELMRKLESVVQKCSRKDPPP